MHNISKKIKTALISTFNKEGLDSILIKLKASNVKLISTGTTLTFIESLGFECQSVEDLTGYPSILGGRIRTLHPKIFGGILSRRELDEDSKQVKAYGIPEIDLVIVDLYPFEDVVVSGADESDIIDKIDVGEISLIRAAAKNFKDVLVVSSRKQYDDLEALLDDKKGITDIEDRRFFAQKAFAISSSYDSAISNYFNNYQESSLRLIDDNKKISRNEPNLYHKGSYTFATLYKVIYRD